MAPEDVIVELMSGERSNQTSVDLSAMSPEGVCAGEKMASGGADIVHDYETSMGRSIDYEVTSKRWYVPRTTFAGGDHGLVEPEQVCHPSPRHLGVQSCGKEMRGSLRSPFFALAPAREGRRTR